MYWNLGWGSIQDGVQLFQYLFLTGVLLGFSWGGGLIKTGAQFAPIRYFGTMCNAQFTKEYILSSDMHLVWAWISSPDLDEICKNKVDTIM